MNTSELYSIPSGSTVPTLSSSVGTFFEGGKPHSSTSLGDVANLAPPGQSSSASALHAESVNAQTVISGKGKDDVRNTKTSSSSVSIRGSRSSYQSFCDGYNALKKREVNDANRDLFKIQFAYTQEWFMRSSWVEKFHFLVLLIEESGNNVGFLRNLLQLLRAGNAKDLIYSTNQNSNAFYYDIVPEDDNRAMDYATLMKVQVTTRLWFVNLIDCEKLEVFVGLISLSGGALLREVYLHVSKLLAEKHYEEIALHQYKSVEVVARLSERLGITEATAYELSKDVEMQDDEITLSKLGTETQSSPRSNLDEGSQESLGKKGSAGSKKKGSASSKKKGTKENKEEKDNESLGSHRKKNSSLIGEELVIKEATPSEQACKLSKERLRDKMAETRLAFGLDENLRPITAGKPTTAGEPKSKGKKKKTKSAGGKEDKKKKAEVLDEIQLLPLWANRPIMMQLDDDELIRKKKVSRYWAAMIDEVRREQKVREELDDVIEDYMQLLDPSNTQGSSPSSKGKSSKKSDKGSAKGSKKGSAKGSKKASAKGSKKSSAKDLKKRGAKGKKGKQRGMKRPHLLSIEGEVLEMFQPEPPLGEEAMRKLVGSKESPHMKNIYQGRHCVSKLIQDFLHSRVMACCPQGRLVAISSHNRVVEFHSLLTGCRLTPRLVGHSGIITCMAFHDDGDHIMTGSLDTTVRFWNIWSHRAVKIYLGHFGTVSSLSLSKDIVATGGYDKIIKVFHIWSGQCVMTAYEDHAVSVVVLSSDTKLVYSGCRSGQICVYSTVNGECVSKVAGHSKGVTSLFLSPPLLASAGKDGFARLWNTNSLGPNCLIAMDHGRAVTAISISHLRVITGCESGRMRVWCALSGQLLKLMRVCPTTRPIRDLHCIEEVDHAKIVVCTETGIKIYEFDPLTAPNKKNGNFSRLMNAKLSHSKFLLDLNKKSTTQYSPRSSLSGWQELLDRDDLHPSQEQDVELKGTGPINRVELRNMRDSNTKDLERRMCTDPNARVKLDNCPIVTNTFFTKIVAKNTGTIFTEAPGELCEIFPRKKPPLNSQEFRLPLKVPTWEEYCKRLKLKPKERTVIKKKSKPSHKNLMHLYRTQRLSI